MSPAVSNLGGHLPSNWLPLPLLSKREGQFLKRILLGALLLAVSHHGEFEKRPIPGKNRQDTVHSSAARFMFDVVSCRVCITFSIAQKWRLGCCARGRAVALIVGRGRSGPHVGWGKRAGEEILPREEEVPFQCPFNFKSASSPCARPPIVL